MEVHLRRQTFIAKPNEIPAKKTVMDASGVPLGRLAVEIAMTLMGKHRPEYTPHVFCGDRVVVTNASKVMLTGRKAEQKLKLRYTKYPGGQKAESYGGLRDRKPEFLVQDAVRRMLPKNRLSRVMLKNLTVHAGAEDAK